MAASTIGEPGPITFETDRLDVDGEQIVVEGRWFGVRGRRFVRPALVLVDESGAERRLLAELEGKPWVASDGEAWRATFAAPAARELALDGMPTLELSVAPDITITVRGEPRAPQAPAPRPIIRNPDDGAATSTVPPARPAPADPPPAAAGRRPGARGQDLDRLRARLTATETDLERERQRREAAESALEEPRAEARRLTAELGHARAALEVAEAARREAEASADALEPARRELRDSERRRDALRAELAKERGAHERERAGHIEARAELRRRTAEHAQAREALLALQDELAAARVSERSAPEPAATPVPVAPRGAEPMAPAPHPPVRPVNPSLRSSASPVLRLLALLVILAFLAAIYAVLRSTVLH